MNSINPKMLMGLGGAAMVALIAAFVISSQRQPATESDQAAGYAVVELRDHVNDVKGVTISVAEDKPVVSLSRAGNGWTIKEKGGYAADTGKLRELLLKLADASVLEQKTANEQRYGELGVEDTKAKDAKGVVVAVEGLSKPVRLVVGNYSAKSSGTYVRRADEKQSWLVKGNLTIERDPANWMDKTIVDIASSRIGEINLAKPGSKPVRVYKAQPADTTFTVADVPAGREAATDVLNGLASTLSGLTLTEALSQQDAKMPGDDQLVKAVYQTAEGLKINVWGWKKDGKDFVRLAAVLEQDRASAYVDAAQAKAKGEYEEKLKSDSKAVAPLAVSDPGKDRAQQLSALAAEVADISRRVEGWVFVIPSYKFGNMEKTVNDLLKPLTPVQPAEAKPGPGKGPDIKKPEAKKPEKKAVATKTAGKKH